MPDPKSSRDTMSTEELVRERDALDALIAERREGEKQTLLAEFRERARALGLDLDELTPSRSGSGKGAKRGKVRPKYRNPSEPHQTWTGRGRKPKWVEAELGAGRHLDDLLIERPAAAA